MIAWQTGFPLPDACEDKGEPLQVSSKRATIVFSYQKLIGKAKGLPLVGRNLLLV